MIAYLYRWWLCINNVEKERSMDIMKTGKTRITLTNKQQINLQICLKVQHMTEEIIYFIDKYINKKEREQHLPGYCQ